MRLSVLSAIFVSLISIHPLHAATIDGLVGLIWDDTDVFARQTIGEVEAYIADQNNTPDAAFIATEINYPRNGVASQANFQNFLGDDFASLRLADPTADPSKFEPEYDFIMLLTGFITLDPGTYTFNAQVDDGMSLRIAGHELIRARTAPSDNISYSNPISSQPFTSDGKRMAFSLLYFDAGASNYGLRVDANGTVLDKTILTAEIPSTPVVPLPAAGWLLMAACLGLAGLRRL